MYKKALLVPSLFVILGADISGGDLKHHDLKPNSDALRVITDTPAIVGCGAPPAGYFIWMDGDDPYAGGATPADPSTWIDKGREGRVFDQPNTAHRPALNTGYLTFDGSDDYLKAGNDSAWSELFSSSDHFCNHLVRNNSHGNTKQAIWGTYSTGSAGRANFNVITDLSGAQQEFYVNNGAGQHTKVETSFTEPLNTWYNYKTEYDRAGLQARTGNDATWSGYTAADTAAADAPILSYYTYNIGGLSAGASYGSDTSSIWEWSGDIAQIICYTDLTKESAVETWISCKAGEL